MSNKETEPKVDQFETVGDVTEEFHKVEGVGQKVKVLIEQISDPQTGKPTFLIHRYGIHFTHDYDISPAYEKTSTLHYIPVDPSPFPRVGLPDWGENESGIPEAELYDEILAFVKKHIWFSSESMYYALASYCLATWIYEAFNSFPYVFFLGDFGVGKTRGLEIIEAIGHRGFKTPDASPAVIYTIGEYWKPSLLFDESEGLQTEAKLAILALANAGYKRNNWAFRMAIDENGRRKIERFNVYFPKGFAGTRELAKTLESRCIQFKMIEKPPSVKLNDYVDDAWAYKLRNKLLGYRILNLNRTVTGFIDSGVDNSRIKELFTPIMSVTPDNYKASIIEYAQKTEGILNSVRADSSAVTLLECIFHCYKQAMSDDRCLYLSQIKLELVQKLDELDNVKDEKRINEKYIVRCLKEIGFAVETIRRNNKSRYILWDTKFENWLTAILPQYIKDKKYVNELLAIIGKDDKTQAQTTLAGAPAS